MAHKKAGSSLQETAATRSASAWASKVGDGQLVRQALISSVSAG